MLIYAILSWPLASYLISIYFLWCRAIWPIVLLGDLKCFCTLNDIRIQLKIAFFDERERENRIQNEAGKHIDN